MRTIKNDMIVVNFAM